MKRIQPVPLTPAQPIQPRQPVMPSHHACGQDQLAKQMPAKDSQMIPLVQQHPDAHGMDQNVESNAHKDSTRVTVTSILLAYGRTTPVDLTNAICIQTIPAVQLKANASGQPLAQHAQRILARCTQLGQLVGPMATADGLEQSVKATLVPLILMKAHATPSQTMDVNGDKTPRNAKSDAQL